MSENTKTNRAADCDVCGLAHDDEIHEATLSVHRWFQTQVTRYLTNTKKRHPPFRWPEPQILSRAG